MAANDQAFNMNCMLPAHQKQQLLGLLGEEAGEVGLLVADRPEQLVLVATVERRLPDQHLVEEDAKGPPVHAVAVLQALDDLKHEQHVQHVQLYMYFRSLMILNMSNEHVNIDISQILTGHGILSQILKYQYVTVRLQRRRGNGQETDTSIY